LAKYIIKENKIITEFLGGLFKAIAKRKSSKLLKVLSRDPVMKRHIAAADKLGREIIQHIEKEKKDDPEYAATIAAINKLVGR
jgi:TusA-related sulfurtransferase